MDKLIFLDIDGVVNTLEISDKPYETNTGKIPREDFYFELCMPDDGHVSNTQAVMWLNKLCRDSGARIVISSTWRGRNQNYQRVAEALYNTGLFEDIIIEGATEWLDTSRGTEILKYLKDHYPYIQPSYVILDDDADMDGCMDHLVQCNTHHGFGYPEYEKALKILKNT
jgi:hypothetical protein